MTSVSSMGAKQKGFANKRLALDANLCLYVTMQPGRTSVREIVMKCNALIRVHKHKFHFVFRDGQHKIIFYLIHVIVNWEV